MPPELITLIFHFLVPATLVLLFARRIVRGNIRVNPVGYPPESEMASVRFLYLLAFLWASYGLLMYVTGTADIGEMRRFFLRHIGAAR